MTGIGLLQTAITREYAASVGLAPEARYVSGAPLRPVVPLDTAVGGVFVLGAYPSARFELVGGVSNVPVADNLGPFENERWFDGSRVRVQPSARELNDYFLGPLGIKRSACWITDLVKVFLFKEGHRLRYEKLGAVPPIGYERERFDELAHLSLPWIQREIALAQPRLVITLGSEVAGIVRGVAAAASRVALLQASVELFSWGSLEVPTIHCAHPGILMRPAGRNPWPERHRSQFIGVMNQHLSLGV